ncbi:MULTISPECIES: alpha/beta hydrolase-fold protein [unclassified Streptomyces]|uniref:alpha/beta hydrolase n=1 Tax=Streptomyces TaxID=1883 RepID=UPI001FD2DCFD|nr:MULTISPECIES: alpha/beta hydrolase-fold protein [unclassified Streptomyces]MCZ4102191.1 alpha/beta hydrolase-fold protein [Streptomyces sp. H39-C1]
MFLRLSALLLTQAFLLSTLGLLANDYFAFYSSWSDLLGRNQDTGVIQGAVDPGAHRGHVQVLGSDNIPGHGALHSNPAQVGRLDRVRISGTGTRLSTDGYIYLPPQYFQRAFKSKRFPALLALTGFPGDARNLVTKLRYPSTELQMLKDKAMEPLIQVLMRPSPSMPRDSECEDIPGGPQSQTYFTTEIPQSIRASYRVLSGPGSLALMGDSTGGYCAAKLAMEHPKVFSAAVSLSGYFKAAEDITTGDLFGGSKARRDRADLNWRLAHLPAPAVALLLADSKQDGHTYADSQRFAASARRPMIVTQATVETGGHNFTTWIRLLPPSFGWLSTHLAKPQ